MAVQMNMTEARLVIFIKNWLRRPTLYTAIKLDGVKIALEDIAGVLLIKGIL